MTYVLIASTALAGILLFLLAAASANTALFARHYPMLVALNFAVAVGLVLIVGYQLWMLGRALRRRLFGSRLTLRLLVLFALMALIPGALVYTVSVQFLAKSIESWFDVRVDSALEGGVNLGRAALDSLLDELHNKAQTTAQELAETGAAQQTALLDRLRERAGADEAIIIGATGVIASATRDLSRFVPETPPAAVLRQARQNRGYRAIDALGDRPSVLRVIVPIGRISLGEEPRLLQLTSAVPTALASSAESVQAVKRSYNELSIARQGLKQIYILALTLALLLALFSALALAFLLSRRLSDPLAALAEATQAVARGDFTQRPPVSSRDELGILTRSFNSMTAQLDDARTAAERNRLQVESAKAHLENVLANLSAGVLVFDRDMQVQIANASVGQILGAAGNDTNDASLKARLAPIVDLAREAFAAADKSTPWQREIVIGDRAQVLLVRGSRLPETRGGDFVVVFDDVTAIVEAQRATAWAEVAQRLAHEIKNPLTPIQLAAERLQVKLAGHLDATDAQALQRGTDTIIAQVHAMKRMVDEFREYARLPAPILSPLDLNSVVTDMLPLYESAHPPVRVRLHAKLPRVQGDASQLRQVIHNLLLNAQDASAAPESAAIEISTEAKGGKVYLRVRDHGVGFSEQIMRRAFEPYVTTKPKGTGLGLAIVKKIVDEHHGSVQLDNAPDRGAVVTIGLPAIESPVAQAA
jgi:nitrogen fixation/metabolism regulation signal transduction histidine kinase